MTRGQSPSQALQIPRDKLILATCFLIGMSERNAAAFIYDRGIPAIHGGRDLNCPNTKWHQSTRENTSIHITYILYYVSGGEIVWAEVKEKTNE